MDDTAETTRAINAVFRMEQAKLIAALARMTRDVGVAEELAQDALVTALEKWPASGTPDNPAAWLMATAKNRAVDHMRRKQLSNRKHAEVAHDIESARDDIAAVLDASLDQDIDDDLLRLIFISCHPILPAEARVALTLRLLCGLTTDEIARAFLASEATIAQRIVRAKRALAEAKVPFELPPAAERSTRLSSVLEVIYLVFNEGYAATAGEDWIRPALCEEALRLGRVLAALMPNESEVHGLVALMEIQASRLRARTDEAGAPVLLLDQNRALWDRLLIGRGMAALDRAETLNGRLGPYALQAAIASCHAQAITAQDTNWPRIAALYDILAQVMPSPIVDLNRAVAHGMAFGPSAGLAIADTLVDEPALKSYHLLPSVRGDLLQKLGRLSEAKSQFERAASLTRNERERELSLARAAQCEKDAR